MMFDLSFLTELWKYVDAICQGLQDFINVLSDGIEQLSGNGSAGTSLLYHWLGVYHFVIGDYLFDTTWILINVGVFYALFKLLILLKSQIMGDNNGLFGSFTSLWKGIKAFGGKL